MRMHSTLPSESLFNVFWLAFVIKCVVRALEYACTGEISDAAPNLSSRLTLNENG